MPLYRTWSEDRLLKVLDTVLQWDGIAFCLIDRAGFRDGFRTGSTKHCSPILVDALLALAAALFRSNAIDETENANTKTPAWKTFGSTMASQAVQAIHRGAWPPQNRPDIQALGVLSLYCTCLELRYESQDFAVSFAEATSRRCTDNLIFHPVPQGWRPANASVFCGAVSISRWVEH